MRDLCGKNYLSLPIVLYIFPGVPVGFALLFCQFGGGRGREGGRAFLYFPWRDLWGTMIMRQIPSPRPCPAQYGEVYFKYTILLVYTIQ